MAVVRMKAVWVRGENAALWRTSPLVRWEAGSMLQWDNPADSRRTRFYGFCVADVQFIHGGS